jgi:steroid delta-isomerase-like uncharacterized protein
MKHLYSICMAACCAILLVACSKGQGTAEAPKTDSTLAKNKAANEAFYAAMNAHDIDGCVKLCDANFAEHSPMPDQKPGPEGMRDMMKMWFAAFPDAHVKILNVVAEGDMVATLSQTTGTNTGPFMGMPATNKKVDVLGIDWVRLKDGKAVEHWGYMDFPKWMADMGMPMGGPPPEAGKGAKPKK